MTVAIIYLHTKWATDSYERVSDVLTAPSTSCTAFLINSVCDVFPGTHRLTCTEQSGAQIEPTDRFSLLRAEECRQRPSENAHEPTEASQTHQLCRPDWAVAALWTSHPDENPRHEHQ